MPFRILDCTSCEIDDQWTIDGVHNASHLEAWKDTSSYMIHAKKQDATIRVVLADERAGFLKFKNGVAVIIRGNAIAYQTQDVSSSDLP